MGVTVVKAAQAGKQDKAGGESSDKMEG